MKQQQQDDEAKNNNKTKCSVCVQLLQQALETKHSKPAHLLQSMMSMTGMDDDETINSNIRRAKATTTTANLDISHHAGMNTAASASVTGNESASTAANIEWRRTDTGVQVRIPVAAPEAAEPAVLEPSSSTASALLLGRRLSFWREQQSQHQQPSPPDVTNNNNATVVSSLFRRNSSNSGIQLATSPSSTTTNQQQQQPITQQTEWISLSCRDCETSGPEKNARAFVMGPQPLSVVVCQNRLQNFNTEEMQEILTHELIHIYDVRKLALDLTKCRNLAYSEVRAAREAECQQTTTNTIIGNNNNNNTNNNNNETAATTASNNNNATSTSWFFGGNRAANYSPYQQQQECVRQKAMAATRNLFPGPMARHCIQQVFEQAYHDRRPFVSVSENNKKKETDASTSQTTTTSPCHKESPPTSDR